MDVKCLFLDYAFESKGYRLWCPNMRKIILSRDITFNENTLFCYEKEHFVFYSYQQGISEKVDLEMRTKFHKIDHISSTVPQ